MVPTPMVIAFVGTFSLPPKSLEASLLVRSSKVTNLVPELGADH